MNPDWRNNRDLIAGLLFIVLGGLAVVLAFWGLSVRGEAASEARR